MVLRQFLPVRGDRNDSGMSPQPLAGPDLPQVFASSPPSLCHASVAQLEVAPNDRLEVAPDSRGTVGSRGRGEPQAGDAGDALGGHCGGEPAPRAAYDAPGDPGPAGPGSGRGAVSRPRGRTGCGSPTSRMSRRWPASSTWPSSSTCSAGGSWVRRWLRTCARRW